jgi:hypothetical protein
MVVCWPDQPQLRDSAEVTAANVGLRPGRFAIGTSAPGREVPLADGTATTDSSRPKPDAEPSSIAASPR